MKKSDYILTHKMEDGNLFIYNAITRSSTVLPKKLNINNFDDLMNMDDKVIKKT